MLKDNPQYKIAFESEKVTLYMPVDLSDYHKSREVAMQAQERYSKGGISLEVLQATCNDALERINKQNSTDKLRTDMTVLWSNLLARTKEPVDELCAIRMGAMACFCEDEDPDKVLPAFTDHKLRLAKEDPNLYAFFLDMGIAFTPSYSSLLRSLNMQDYLIAREQMLNQLTLQTAPNSE